MKLNISETIQDVLTDKMSIDLIGVELHYPKHNTTFICLLNTTMNHESAHAMQQLPIKWNYGFAVVTKIFEIQSLLLRALCLKQNKTFATIHYNQNIQTTLTIIKQYPHIHFGEFLISKHTTEITIQNTLWQNNHKHRK